MTFAYHRRVKAAESRSEAFQASATPDEVHRAVHTHFVSQGAAERAAAFLEKTGRPGYGTEYCESCDQGYKLTKPARTEP